MGENCGTNITVGDEIARQAAEAMDRSIMGEAPPTFVRKWGAAQVRVLSAERRLLEAVVSDETKDRYGDVIRAAGWRTANYLKNPVILWAHDYSSPPIGRATEVSVRDKRLVKVIEFDTREFAQEVFRLYADDFLSAFSVGFMPLKWEKVYEGEGDERKFVGFEFLEQELLESSAVPVPANPNALVGVGVEGAWAAVLRTISAAARRQRPEATVAAPEEAVRALKELNAAVKAAHRR